MSDFLELADSLSKICSRFILSINDHLKMRDVFKAFNIKPVHLSYSASKSNCTKARELLITN